MSQYKDSITGQIVANLKVYNNKLLDLSPCKIVANSTQFDSLIKGEGKFTNDSAFYLAGSNSKTGPENNMYLCKILDNASTKFTISFWLKRINSGDGYSATGGINWCDQNFHYTCCLYFNFNNGNHWLSTQLSNGSWPTASSRNYTFNNNTYYHIGFTYDSSIGAKIYINGTLHNTYTTATSLSSSLSKYIRLRLFDSKGINTYIDDYVVIADQVLWNDNFTVPNYYLLGDVEIPDKIKKSDTVFPTMYAGDEFEQIFLY